MTLYGLQKVLGDNIEYISDMALSEEERKAACEKATVITGIAKQMINNADVILRTDKLLADGVLNTGSSTIEKIVGGN